MQTNLPSEVWRAIFEDVVHIPGALEAVMTTQFEWFEWRYNEENKYAESMKNKLSLVRVCKDWYPLTVELLYEDIRPRSLEEMASLRFALDESTQSDGHLGRGWWTQRLDLPKERIPDTLLYSFITCLPNLRILRFSYINHIPYQFKNSLPKLRYTQLEPNGQHIPIPINLCTLLLVISIGRYEYTFSNVTALEIYFNWVDPSILRGYSFPNLQHLTLCNNISTDLPAIEPFLQLYGHQLLSLCINSVDLCSAIEQLLSNIPNIQELIFPWFAMPPYDTNVFPSVTHIGLTGGFHQFDALMNPFLAIPRFPNVQCIRMANMVFTSLEGAATKLKAWYRDSNLTGVIFEDAERNLLSDEID